MGNGSHGLTVKSFIIWWLVEDLLTVRVTWQWHHLGLFMERKKVALIQADLDIERSGITSRVIDWSGWEGATSIATLLGCDCRSSLPAVEWSIQPIATIRVDRPSPQHHLGTRWHKRHSTVSPSARLESGAHLGLGVWCGVPCHSCHAWLIIFPVYAIDCFSIYSSYVNSVTQLRNFNKYYQLLTVEFCEHVLLLVCFNIFLKQERNQRWSQRRRSFGLEGERAA